MRTLHPAFALALLAFNAGPVIAQTATPNPSATPTSPATPAPSAPAPSAPGPATAAPTTAAPSTGTAAKPRHPRRMSLNQRFAAANVSGDGHLTRDQADAAKWTYVSRHFDAIDKDHKGYVTIDDIRAYSKAAHASRHRSTPGGPTATTPVPATPAPAMPAPATSAPTAPTPAPAPAPAPGGGSTQ